MVGNITFYDFCCFRCVAVNMCINLVFNINIGYNSTLQNDGRKTYKNCGLVIMKITTAACFSVVNQLVFYYTQSQLHWQYGFGKIEEICNQNALQYVPKQSVVYVIFSITFQSATACYRKSVCPSVCLSVCLSVTWVDQSKRLKLGSCNFHHTVAPSLSCLRYKFHQEIPTGSPRAGRQMRVGWGKELTLSVF